MYERAAREHGIDVAQSFVIGDSPDDMRAARLLGARCCLVRTGWAADPEVAKERDRHAATAAGGRTRPGTRGELPPDSGIARRCGVLQGERVRTPWSRGTRTYCQGIRCRASSCERCFGDTWRG
ncbi:MAG: HAD hydrolase-like protein [Luteitalea sp.]|nr:HAD hydrolase-like protein [Luteitalea sp.]